MSYFKVAANGAAAIVSETVIMANGYIDYNQVIGIIKEQEKEEEERRNPPSMLAPVEEPIQAAGATQTAMSTPTNNIPISRIANKIHVGDDLYPGTRINNLPYNPAKESTIRDSHTSQGSRPEQPKWPQPVLPPGSCSSDPQDKRYRSGKSIPNVQNEEDEAFRNIRRTSGSQRSHKKDSINHQSERQSDRTTTRTLEYINFPHTNVYDLKKSCDETTFLSLEKKPRSPGSK